MKTNLAFEITLGHGCVLVEERGDEVWVDGHEEEGHHHREEPEVNKEEVSAPEDDLDDTSEDGGLCGEGV